MQNVKRLKVSFSDSNNGKTRAYKVLLLCFCQTLTIFLVASYKWLSPPRRGERG